MKITFISTSDDPSIPEPIPAVKKIPEWYKSIPRYIGGDKKPSLKNNLSDGTIKTCMPVLDAMTAGYLILSSADVYISKEPEGTMYQWANHDLITFHSPDQITGYPKFENKLKGEKAPKFTNHWIIQTPKNYSCLFVTPFHHDLPFRTLEGVVDTDTYFNPVNFPFIPDPEFEGLIPRGTPIAQVIPFKRESWSMFVNSLRDSKELQEKFLRVKGNLLSQFFDKYKKHYWTKKEYK
jgi:hypothetical protein